MKRLALPALVLTVLAACSNASVSPSALPAQPGGDSSSSYGRLFAQVQDDGSVDLQAALEAFSLVIAPLPGVDLPAADPPAMYERASGDFAVDWIARHLAELTPQQRAAVDAALAPSPARTIVQPVAASAILLAAMPPTKAEELPYLAALREADVIFANALGRPLSIRYSLTLNDTISTDPKTRARSGVGTGSVSKRHLGMRSNRHSTASGRPIRRHRPPRVDGARDVPLLPD